MRIVRRQRLCLVVALAPLAAGCMIPLPAAGDMPSEIRVSSDGETAAFLWEHELSVGVAVENVALRQTLDLCWGDTRGRRPVRRRRIATWSGFRRGGGPRRQFRVLVSPTGKRLALVGPDGLEIIDTASDARRQWAMPGSWCTSLGWIGDSVIGYVTHTPSPDDLDSGNREFWLRPVDGAVETARMIHRLTARPPTSFYFDWTHDWPHEYWSPNGKYVLFASRRPDYGASILDVEQGKVTQVGAGAGTVQHACWNPTGTQVAWSGWIGSEKRKGFYLLDLPSMQLRDLSQQWRASLDDDERHDFEGQWTGDGRFIVDCRLHHGGRLIQPEPWRVIELGRKLGAPGDTPFPIYAQAAPGVVTAWCRGGSSVVDYEGKILTRLTGGWGSWTLLPDGRTAVNVNRDRQIIVKQWRPPQTQAGTRKSR